MFYYHLAGITQGCTLDFFLMCSLGHGNGKVIHCAFLFA
jgi:hypothetical protein